ncbi:MAG: DUF2164 family protein [Pseudomonadota bacterium]
MKVSDLSEETLATLREDLRREYQSIFDKDLSDFRAEALLNSVMKTVAPAIYNSAVQDVRAHLQSQLDDLDGEVYLDP